MKRSFLDAKLPFFLHLKVPARHDSELYHVDDISVTVDTSPNICSYVVIVEKDEVWLHPLFLSRKVLCIYNPPQFSDHCSGSDFFYLAIILVVGLPLVLKIIHCGRMILNQSAQPNHRWTIVK